jgi:hypothetical protein
MMRGRLKMLNEKLHAINERRQCEKAQGWLFSINFQTICILREEEHYKITHQNPVCKHMHRIK